MTNEELAEIYARCFPLEKTKWSVTDITAHEARASGLVLRSSSGAAFLQIVTDEGEILSIFIDPDAQGKGNGRALLAQACESLRNLGAKRIFLEVAAHNHRAISLYKAADFQQIGLRKNYYSYLDGRKADACIFSKTF